MDQIENRHLTGTLKAVVIAASVALSTTVLLLAANVVTRSFNRSIPGVYDLANLCSAVAGSLAIAYTTYKKGHVNVDIITNILPPVPRMIQQFVSDLLFTAVFILITWQSFVVFFDRITTEFTDTFHIPYWPFRLVWCIAMVIATAIGFIRTIGDLKGARN